MLTALVLLGGCSGGALDGLIKVDGSSTVFPLTALVAEAFMDATPGVRVAVGVSGTGGGFAKFGRGETDVSDASRPIKDKEAAKVDGAGYGFIELPVAYDGLVVAVNPGATWVACLTVEELGRLWKPGATINNWKDLRPGFPDKPIRLYGAGTDSGTYDYFTAAVVGEEGKSRADYTASEDDNVLVQGVAGDDGALAFFGLAYLDANRDKVKAVAIDGGKGRGCVAPTAASVEDGTYQPLARPEFIYVRADRAEDPAVAAFIRYYLQHAAALGPRVGAVPLSAEAYRLGLQRFEARTRGSVFHGSTVGVKLADLLRAEGEPADSATAAPAPGAARPEAVRPR